MRKQFKQLASCTLAVALAASSALGSVSFNATYAEAAPLNYVTASPNRVSVHDPSICISNDGTYYVFGSHIDAAKSDDLVNWSTFTNGYDSKNNALYGDLSKNLKKPFAWAGENDVDSSGGYAVWAPDVFWNENYVNKDGSKGAYMIYFCTTSTYKRSVIAYGVSQDIEGPYETVDTIVYSGFTKDKSYDFGSKINLKYTNTNISDLIKDGTLKDGVNNSWFTSGGEYNTAYAPNAIDPTVFDDKDGNLWMTYGSWSGGIYVLQIDPATGAAIYPGTSKTTEDGLVVDEYFGTRIGGGYTKSGEGPYILYDADSDYYYLYMTYEGLAADQGYNMRLFRSKSPDGPYLDAAGNNAALTGNVNHNNIGIKVMGNYKFSCQSVGYKAPGHNSAFIENVNGHNYRYLLYHTRFDDGGGWMHQLRVHQQFLNEEGWPVTAVFENKGETISDNGYNREDIVGNYEFINHGTQSDMANVAKPKSITLNDDGTISGDIKGTWEVKDGTYYMKAIIGDVTYSGVFFLQSDESAEAKKVMTFTAIGTDNKTIWGVRKEAYKYSNEEIVERAIQDLNENTAITDKTTADLSLATKGFKDASITWESDNTAAISNDGKVTRGTEPVEVTLTATVKSGDVSDTAGFVTTVLPNDIKPDYRYDFEKVNGTTVENVAVSDNEEDSTTNADATLTGSATIKNEGFVGNVLNITSNADDNGKNYLALPKDLFKNADNSGFTVSMWAKFSSSTSETSALFEAKNSTAYSSKPVTGVHVGTYSSFESNEGSVKQFLSVSQEPNTWGLVTYTVTPKGITTYINGKKLAQTDSDLSRALNSNVLSQIDDIRVGSGTVLGDEDVRNASFDNIEFYSVALSENDIQKKYDAEKASYPNIKLSANKSTIYAKGDTVNTAKVSVSNSESSLKFTTAYSSSDASIATVNADGKVTAKKAGTATITATLTSGDKTMTISKKITVKKAYLKMSKKKTSLKVGKSAAFKVKGYGLTAKSVKWSSSKSSVLTVTKSGKVTAKKAGTATITAKYKTFKVSVKVKVKK